MNCFIITHSGSTYHWLEYYVSKRTAQEAVNEFRGDFPNAIIHRISIELELKTLKIK